MRLIRFAFSPAGFAILAVAAFAYYCGVVIAWLY